MEIKTWLSGLTAAKKAPYCRTDSSLQESDFMGFELDEDVVRVAGCTEKPVSMVK